MVFSSLLFLFRFLPAVLILYYAAPRKFRNVILFLFSLFFYAWGEPRYVFLMLFTITLDFFIGKGIAKAKEESEKVFTDFDHCRSVNTWIFQICGFSDWNG